MDSFFSSLGELYFFDTIQQYLTNEAEYFMVTILGNTYALLGGALLTLMTIWVLIHGYRIMSGQSRESLMGFMMTSAKAVVIITVATAVGVGGGRLFQSITDGTAQAITYLITGEDDSDPYKEIDKNLKLMQSGLGAMKAIDTGDNEAVESERTQALWMSGAGTAGPAIVAGTMLLINKFGMVLFIGLAPIFILFLLFDQTKPMFQSWLKFGLGLMISMAVLTMMSGIAMKMVGALALVAFAQDFFVGGSQGFTSAAMQQGGLGLILTALLITVPNMATTFIGTTASGFIGANAMGSYGAVPQAGGGSGGGGAYGGGGVYGGAPPQGLPPIQGNTGGSNGPQTLSHGARNGFLTDSANSTNYSTPRTDSAMGAAAGSTVTAAQNASAAAPSGVTAYAGSSGGTASFAPASASVQATTANAGGAQPMQRSYADIVSGSSSSGGAAASTVASSNPTAQTLTQTSTAPSSEVSSGSAATGTRTAGVSDDSFSQIRKGSQHPTRG